MKAARRLARRVYRAEHRLFLAEGPQAVREALTVPGCVAEVFAVQHTDTAHPDIFGATGEQDLAWHLVDDAALASLTDTVHPQGLVAVCHFLDRPLDHVLSGTPKLVAVCADVRDPGNAGTILRSAEAAGAAAVVFCDGSVDVFNPKTVRASAGALFHVPVVASGPPAGVLERLGVAGYRRYATVARGGTAYDEADLAGKVAIVFGNEAHGLPDGLHHALDGGLTIPMAGRAESLNVGMAAAVVCFEALRQRRAASARALS